MHKALERPSVTLGSSVLKSTTSNYSAGIANARHLQWRQQSDSVKRKPKRTFAYPKLSTEASFASSHVSHGDVVPKDSIRPFHSIFASFWRGGTSKGVFIPQSRIPNLVYPMGMTHYEDRFRIRLEDCSEKLAEVLQRILGSPDPYGRQLNGLGGGISSLSKAVIYRRPWRKTRDVDVEYTFAQLGVEDGELDLTGNCGNLTAAVGPIALNEGMYQPPPHHFDFTKAVEHCRPGDSHPVFTSVPVTVRLRNTNTQKVIHATFMAYIPSTIPSGRWMYQSVGSYAIDGVSGTASRIYLKFMDPGGSKTGKTLPSGNAIDVLDTSRGSFRVSLVDITNPGIFVAGSDMGWDVRRSPEELNANPDLLDQLEAIRRKGAELMGLDPKKFRATPKIVLVYPPESGGINIRCQVLSMGKAHKAIPGTLALNLGAACRIPGTIPFQIAQGVNTSEVIIGHPSGKVEVGAEVRDGKVLSVELSRTARCLMEGFVNWVQPNSMDLIETPVPPEQPST